MSVEINPFRFTAPVGLDDLIDRDAESELLLSTAREANNSRLVAPRRYGKTSLCRRVLGEISAQGWTGVYVDFFGVLTIGDIADRIDRAYAASLTGAMSRWFAGVRATLGPVSARVGPTSATAAPTGGRSVGQAALSDRLDLPLRIHERSGRRVLVVWDEFQEVLAAGNLDAVLRASIQHHGEAASYLFAGSHPGMMNELFGDPRRAFYAQTIPVHLPPLAVEDCAEFVGDRFEATHRDIGDALPGLLAATGGHPQRTMMLAHAVWNRTTHGRRADEETLRAALDTTMTDLDAEFRVSWLALPASQRRALSAVSRDEPPYGVGSTGGSRGGTVRTALTSLIARGDVIVAGGQHQVVDPLFARWVASGRTGPTGS